MAVEAAPGTRVIVSDGNEIISDAARAGDEPLLLAERLKGQAAVISDADRVSAARWAVENFQSDVFVLDDGFQHLRVARNLNILTIDATNPWGNGKLLPAGILRESLAELTRADCIVITRADDPAQTEELRREIAAQSKDCPVFCSRMRLSGLRAVQPGQPLIAAEEIRSIKDRGVLWPWQSGIVLLSASARRLSTGPHASLPRPSQLHSKRHRPCRARVSHARRANSSDHC